MCSTYSAVTCILRCLMLYTVLGESATTKAKSTVVKLYNNGSAADTVLFPKCAVGERIDLLSYNFISRDCSIDSPCNVTLSATAEFLLHQKCSLQESCLNVTFPISDIRDKNVKGISIEYQCLDQFSSFLDLCSNTTKTSDKNIHLLLGNRLKGTMQCACIIGGGIFSLLLNDIRLISKKDGSRCSETELELDSKYYLCNDTRGDHGSVFNYDVKEEISGITIILHVSFQTDSPQMIWMTISPIESTSIKCESYNIRIGESTTLVNNNTIFPEDVLLNGNRCRKYKYINPELYDKKYEEQSSCTKSENYILLIVKDTNYYLIAIGITLLLVVILLVPLVSMIILWKRKKLRQQHATEHTERHFTTQTKDKRTNGKRNVLRREKDFENDALTSSIEDLEPGDNKEQSTKDKSDSCLNFQESHFSDESCVKYSENTQVEYLPLQQLECQ